MFRREIDGVKLMILLLICIVLSPKWHGSKMEVAVVVMVFVH